MMPRVLTALAGIPLLIFIIGWGQPWHFSLLVFLVTTGALLNISLSRFPVAGESELSEYWPAF